MVITVGDARGYRYLADIAVIVVLVRTCLRTFPPVALNVITLSLMLSIHGRTNCTNLNRTASAGRPASPPKDHWMLFGPP